MQVSDAFRELPQVGERLEAAFHDAGFRTWSDLATASPADVRDAARSVRHTSLKQAAEWQQAAAGRSGAATAVLDSNEPQEQHHSFVVTVHVDEDGRPIRSAVHDARTQIERTWTGWRPVELATAIESGAGLRTRSAPAPRTLASIDAGTTLGGRRDVSLRVPVGLLGAEGTIRYSARLMARALGEQEAVLVGVCRGTAVADRDLALDFVEVEVPPGVQRLSVGMEIDPVAQE